MNQNTSIFSLGLWRSVWRISKPFFMSSDPWFTAYGIRPDISDAGKQRLKGFTKLTALWALAPLLLFYVVKAIGVTFTGLGIIAHDWSFIPTGVETFFTAIGQFVQQTILGSEVVGWLQHAYSLGTAALIGGLITTFLVLIFKRRLVALGVIAAAFAGLVKLMPFAAPYVPDAIGSSVVLSFGVLVTAVIMYLMGARRLLMAFLAVCLAVVCFEPSWTAMVPAIPGLNTIFASLGVFFNATLAYTLYGIAALAVLSFAFSFMGGAMVVEKITYTEKWKAWGLLVLLAVCLLSVNLMNVVINTVAGAFQDALQAKDQVTYYKNLFEYGGIFLIATPIVVFFAWIKSLLVVVWRKWFTGYMLQKYFLGNNSYRLSNNQLVDNPDERIAADVQGFTSGALGLVLTLVDSVMTFVTFFAILWIISPSWSAWCLFTPWSVP
jgi:hypothetical protein